MHDALDGFPSGELCQFAVGDGRMRHYLAVNTAVWRMVGKRRRNGRHQPTETSVLVPAPAHPRRAGMSVRNRGNHGGQDFDRLAGYLPRIGKRIENRDARGIPEAVGGSSR